MKSVVVKLTCPGKVTAPNRVVKGRLSNVLTAQRKVLACGESTLDCTASDATYLFVRQIALTALTMVSIPVLGVAALFVLSDNGYAIQSSGYLSPQEGTLSFANHHYALPFTDIAVAGVVGLLLIFLTRRIVASMIFVGYSSMATLFVELGSSYQAAGMYSLYGIKYRMDFDWMSIFALMIPLVLFWSIATPITPKIKKIFIISTIIFGSIIVSLLFMPYVVAPTWVGYIAHLGNGTFTFPPPYSLYEIILGRITKISGYLFFSLLPILLFGRRKRES